VSEFQSDSIGALAAALAKAQAEIKGAIKDSANPFFKSAYADLSSVWEAARGPLTKNGLAVVQAPTMTPDGLVLRTVLMHSSGEWIAGTMPIKPVKDDPQGMGSATTYVRRYSLAAIAGIAPEDDDGESASGRGEQRTSRPAKASEKSKEPSSEPVIAKTQQDELIALVKDSKIPFAKAKELMLGICGVDQSDKIPANKYPDLVKAIEGLMPVTQ
jgi:hypothetical protein